MSVVLEFFRSDGDPVNLIDLGADFLSAQKIDPANAGRPFRVGIEAKTSKAGNVYYEYSQNGVPLPDGLNSFLKVNGALVALGGAKPSQKGNPTREGAGTMLLGGIVYDVTAYLTETKSGYYVKVIAHKQPDRAKNIEKAQRAPRGGAIL